MNLLRHLPLNASLLLLLLTGCVPKTRVTSPDGRNTVRFGLDSDGRPTYAVERDGKPLILPSLLGIATRETHPTPFTATSIRHTTADQLWEQPWGENKTLRNHYNEMTVTLSSPDEPDGLTLRFRAYDDGIAFRYELNRPDSLTVTDELTEFRVAGDGLSWSIPGNFETYELEYRRQPISAVADANTPFTFRTSTATYGSIHEAALYDYPEMILRRDSASGPLRTSLAPLPDGTKAHIPGRFVTPWRTVQLGDRAVDLINSSLILNLNEPSKISDPSWITPQKYVGVWWGMHLGTQVWTLGPRHGATTENALRHIDFAAANNIQGVLFEGWNQGWENWGGNQHFSYTDPYPDFDLERIAAYAREKGIELWMHNETGGNIPEYEAEMERAMARYAELGVHTLKTGYAGGFRGGYSHHSQYGVQHYQRVVETAARYRLMLDVHEPIKETGIRRTWPNMMTREGARGMEWNAWSAGNSAEYLTTLPFVRLLSGPMDYTPGIFDLDYSRAKSDPGRIEWNGPNAHCRIRTTLTRQIANWVILYSPLQMAADLIENYDGHPAFRFFRDFDADCDWSAALQGEIGEYIVTVRRAGDRYFLGAGTNDRPRTLTQRLDFLTPGTTYTAVIYADAPDSGEHPGHYRIEERTVTAADTLEIAMAARGGAAVTFLPRDK
ncbi:glycoside hydrolase family 97 protein [uncultured Rikenella sp.]|uniref:glycoside hydrolase family 97 protein n=1 Tax=uncultured Rikenella sp. TaxID=368003 RepID=UPI0025DF7F5E|nr:glycoside hydrolase family 97 protein [uncultured Rikenella sp.]